MHDAFVPAIPAGDDFVLLIDGLETFYFPQQRSLFTENILSAGAVY